MNPREQILCGACVVLLLLLSWKNCSISFKTSGVWLSDALLLLENACMSLVLVYMGSCPWQFHRHWVLLFFVGR